jgi:hypothetical protein
MPFVSSIYQDRQNICLWRLALSTIARTLLAFTLPYLVSYYCVIGAWQAYVCCCCGSVCTQRISARGDHWQLTRIRLCRRSPRQGPFA